MALLLGACGGQQTHDSGEALARVGKDRLYLEDLPDRFAHGLSPEDSVLMQKSLVDQWVRETLLYQEALRRLDDAEEEIAQQVERYKRQLYIRAYENWYVQRHVDTVVSRQDLDSFYSQHREHFLASRPMLRVFLLVAPGDGPQLKSLLRDIRDTTMAGIQHLSTQSLSEGFQVVSTPEQWLSLGELNEELPFKLEASSLRRGGGIFQRKHGGQLYIFNVVEWIPAGQLSPLSCVEPDVKRMIMLERKMALIQTLESEMVQSYYYSENDNGKKENAD
ncbi:MAG: hypothetical protein CSA07_01820 [Bacteroidia bacterium]|nr:MAG: hypothetical protein CSA07_01820 [Bacteroidia bacterium]